MSFRYDPAWVASPEGRSLSLSLPMNFDGIPVSGDRVGRYFDNLLPDSALVRRRIAMRLRTRSQDPFDLLEAIGRDCVGAIQLLPPEYQPDDIHRIEVEPLDETGVERALLAAVAPADGLGRDVDDRQFRISLAGAQEKTAFTWHQGRWCRPRNATPTTHIFKLPMGLVGARQADMSSSVENEWLCSKILQAYGLPVAACEIGRFGGQKALIVERFDRRLDDSGHYWLRLPQEDFCQALGCPAAEKYEADGGPGLLQIGTILRGSEAAGEDLMGLLSTQLVFWMLAATDGHAKNFSLHLYAGDRYRLTPRYDVLSAWPIIGAGPGLLDVQRVRLSMALHGRNKHYRLRDILPRHFVSTAQRFGLGEPMRERMLHIAMRTGAVIDEVGARLPEGYPLQVAETIFAGLRDMARRITDAREGDLIAPD